MNLISAPSTLIWLGQIILSLLAMSNSTNPPSASPVSLVAWRSFVSRSLAAWDEIVPGEQALNKPLLTLLLQGCQSLDDFLTQAGNSFMVWFFQKRSAFMSQVRMKKWSRDQLEDYILLPASPGFVLRRDCFFVSHFWRQQDDPDPDGAYLRLHQAELEPQTWSYIWVDWTCMPQSPRSRPEEAYFAHCLKTMPGIIRNCGFAYFYPPFEPRLWILYEITEYLLTCTEGLESTSDIEPFCRHIDEMLETGVQATLTKYRYRCSFDRDRQYLTSWLELVVLFRQLNLNIYDVRAMMDHLTWFPTCQRLTYLPAVELDKFGGTLVVNGKVHTFTPFPQ